jgi:hypothetical protein
MNMKKIVRFFVVTAAVAGSINLASAQNVGVTDKTDGIAPASLFQVHKDGTTSNTRTLIQMSDGGTAATSSDGFQLGIDSSQNGIIVNKETGKGIWIGRSGTNNTTIENDGTIMFNGAATVWDDLRVSFASRSTGSAPTMTAFAGGTTLYEWAYTANASDKFLYCEVQLPHSWKEGTRIYPHIHWTSSSTNSGNVVWNMDFSWQNVLGTPGTYGSTTLATITAAASGVSWRHQINNLQVSGTDGIDGTGKTISSILVCRIWRDGGIGADSYPDNAFLIGFDIHYEIDGIGSRTTTAK